MSKLSFFDEKKPETLLELIKKAKNHAPSDNDYYSELIDLSSEIINNKHNINDTDDKGNTALHVAASGDYRFIELLRTLISKGANIEAKTSSGETPLMMAVIANKVESVSILLDAGAEIETKSKLMFRFGYSEIETPTIFNEEATPLFYAVLYKHTKIINLLLEHGANTNAVCSPLVHSILTTAIINDASNELIEKLIQHGANVNLSSKFTDYPLYAAITNYFRNPFNYTKILDILVQKGANINLQDEDGNSLLHHAIQKCDSKIVRDLLETTRIWIENSVNINAVNALGNSPLHHAVIEGNIKSIKYLIDFGANVDQQNNKGYTSVHLAILHNNNNSNFPIFLELLKGGANINIQDYDGNTPLMLASTQNHQLDSACWLVVAKADICIHNINKATALGIALKRSDTNLATLLITNTNNINDIIDSDNFLPLAIKHNVKSDAFELVDLLIKHGINLNSTDEDGNTPLHIAIKHYGDGDIEDIIIFNLKNILYNLNPITFDMTTRLTIKNDSYISNVSYIERFPPKRIEKIGIIKLLIHSGADINAQNNQGATALSLSIIWDDIELVEFLIEHKADMNLIDNHGYSAFNIANKYQMNEIAAYISNNLLPNETNVIGDDI